MGVWELAAAGIAIVVGSAMWVGLAKIAEGRVPWIALLVVGALLPPQILGAVLGGGPLSEGMMLLYSPRGWTFYTPYEEPLWRPGARVLFWATTWPTVLAGAWIARTRRLGESMAVGAAVVLCNAVGGAIGLVLTLRVLLPRLEPMVDATLEREAAAMAAASGFIAFGTLGSLLAMGAVTGASGLRRAAIASLPVPGFALLIAAWVTPPDPISHILVTLPLLTGWGVGVLLGAGGARLWGSPT